MGHTKIAPGLTSLTAKEFLLLGIKADEIPAITGGTHPAAKLSSDKFCLYIKPGITYDIMAKSATGKSETKIATCVQPALPITLGGKHVYNDMRVLLDVNPELRKLGPISCPHILEPRLGENINLTLWKLPGSPELPDLTTLEYMYRLYMIS
jgi:hypothetical protein